MSTFESTSNRNYPLPHKDNLLQQDVQRLRTALVNVDSDVQASIEFNDELQQQLSQLKRRVRLNQLLGDDKDLSF